MVAAVELEPGAEYEVTMGPAAQPRGRAVHVRMDNLRMAMMRFPDTGSPERLWPVNTAAIVARWDDPKRAEARRRAAGLATAAAEARRLLAEVGLDVLQQGRQVGSGPAAAVVGPSMGQWTVTIELGAFLRVVAPLVRIGLKRRAYDVGRRVGAKR